MQISFEGVWLTNFLVDGVLLFLSGRVWGRPLAWVRGGVSAALGASWSAVGLAPALGWLMGWPGRILLSVLMALIAWPWRGWRSFARIWLAFLGVTVVAGGAAMAVSVWLDQRAGDVTLIAMGGPLWSTVGGVALAVVLAGWALVPGVKRFAARQRLRCRLGGTFELVGIADTGNLLTEYLTGVAVVLLDTAAARSCLTAQEMETIITGKDATAWVQANTVTGQALLPLVQGKRLEIWRVGRWRDAGEVCLALSSQEFVAGIDAVLPAWGGVEEVLLLNNNQSEGKRT